MKNENILICGGTGFVGQYLIRSFLNEKKKIVVLTRNINRAKKLFPKEVTLYEWASPLTELPPKKAFNSLKGIINLSGESIFQRRWSLIQKKKILDSRVLLTRNLIRAIEKYQKNHHHLPVYIGASSIGYYEKNKKEPLDEKALLGSDFLALVCDSWENEVISLKKAKRKIVFRIGIVIGKEGGVIKKLVPIFRFFLGAILGSGKQMMSWIHIEDLSQMIQVALENPSYRGVYNATSPQPINNKNFSKAIGKKLGRVVFLKIPSFFLKIILGEMASLLLDGQHVYPKKILLQGFCFRYSNFYQGLKKIL